MRLVACSSCHTQYDVTTVADREIDCRCGAKIENRAFDGVEAAVHRCSSCGAQVGADAPSCAYCGSEIIRDTRALSLICPECYARNAEAARYCAGCGVAFRPEAVAEAGVELPCPCCGCLMPVRRVADVAINECPECNGLWVPENRFDHLIVRACEAARSGAGEGAKIGGPRVEGANPYRAKVVYRNCPVCDGHMQRANFQKRSGVIIDRCHRHGTWLDADELEQIAGFIMAGGMGAGGARDYALKTEIDAARRREAEAFARMARGESIVVDTRRQGSRRGSLFGLLEDLLGR